MANEFFTPPPSAQYNYFDGFPFFRKGNDLHSDSAVYFVTEGEFEYGIGGGDRQTVKAGEAVICPPNTNFSKKVISCTSMLLVLFSSASSEALPTGKIVYADNARINDTLIRLKELICSQGSETEAYKAHLLTDLWYSLASMRHSPFTEYSEQIRDPFFSELSAYLDTHPEATLTTLADAFHCSRVTVSRCFRRFAGKTVGQYASELRICKACAMMESTDEPFKVIAERCGFASEYYFSAVFKDKTGYAPGKWRAMRRKKG